MFDIDNQTPAFHRPLFAGNGYMHENCEVRFLPARPDDAGMVEIDYGAHWWPSRSQRQFYREYGPMNARLVIDKASIAHAGDGDL